MQYFYLSALIISLAGLYIADRKYKLVLHPYTTKALIPIIIGIVFFLIWDITGIALDVFTTNQEWVSGINLVTKNLPIEEIFFLALLCYVTLISWSIVCSRTS